MHGIDQLIDGVQTALLDHTGALNKVYTDHGATFEKEHVPYIEITYLSDSENDDLGSMDRHTRDVMIELRLVESKNEGGRASVMAIRSQVETILAPCYFDLDGLDIPIMLSDVEMDVENEAQNNSFECRMLYSFLISYNYGEPDTLV